MGKVRIKLVCMNGRGLSPGAEIVKYLPDHEETTDTYILLHESEGFHFTEDISECNLEEFEVLAKLTKPSSSTFSVVLEPLVDAITIEPSYSTQLVGLYDTAKISVPHSTQTAKHYIHLRPDDTINFSDDGLKVSVMAEIPNNTSSPQPSSGANINVADRHQGEVQVRSSHLDPINNVDDDATSSSDDDLDPTVRSHVAKAPAVGEGTPTTARQAEQAIMETPQAATLTSLLPNEESAPFSTAQEGPTSDTLPLNHDGWDSPTARAQNKRHPNGDSLKDSPLAPLESTRLPDNTDTPDSSPEPLKTYSNQKGRRVAMRPTSKLLVEETSLTKAEQDTSQTRRRSVDGEVRSSSDPAASSEPLQLPEVARAVASGSIGSASAKRKITDIEEDGDEQEGLEDNSQRSSKKPKVVDEQYDDDEEMPDARRTGTSKYRQYSPSIDGISIERSEEQSDADDAIPQEDVEPAPKGKRGRPAKSARRKTKSMSPTEKANLSPEVVVAARRSTKKGVPTSMSPASSATSSVLTGKVLNILLSNDSPCRKGDTAKFLKKQGATIIDDVKTRRTHFVCVLNGDRLTTTAKVLRSLASGKLVVTEDWIQESEEAGKFLDPEDFVHDDLKETIHIDRHTIFQNTNLFFTHTLAKGYGKGWKDIQELAKEAGASHVEQGSSGDIDTFMKGRIDVICFGQAKNDLDVDRLKNQGVKVYHKNLLTESIRKGALDLDMEEHVL